MTVNAQKMIKSAPVSMRSSTPSAISRSWLPLVCLGAALIGYALPWIVGTGAALTFNAYDLAEWVTLIPASNAETPPLLTALLLRLPLMCLSVYAAASAARNRSIVFGIVWLVLAVALLPPFEFINDPGNGNYRQQLGLTIAAVVIGIIPFVPIIRRLVTPRLIGTLAGFVGAISALWGVFRGSNLLAGYEVPMIFGAGAFVCAALCLICGVVTLRDKK